jgi:lipoprotein Spr
MKNLFVVAVATGILTGTSPCAQAQTNVNLEQLNQSGQLRFINSIEITPGLPEQAAQSSTISQRKAEPRTAIASPAGTSIEQCTALQFKYALLLDVEVESLSGSSLYRFIEDWWGTRYRYGGSGRDGIDCSGFTSRMMQDVYGVSLPRTARDQFQVCEMVANSDLQEGDLVFFNTRGGISHVGVYLGNQGFVHSSTNGGVTISSLLDEYYSKRFLGGGRVKDGVVSVGR